MHKLDEIAAIAAAKEHVRYVCFNFGHKKDAEEINPLILEEILEEAAKIYAVSKRDIEVELMLSMVRHYK